MIDLGSAHRFTVSLLLAELGRSLSGAGQCGAGSCGGGEFGPDDWDSTGGYPGGGSGVAAGSGIPIVGGTPGAGARGAGSTGHVVTAAGNSFGAWSGAARSGGLAGDSRELISLCAGFALGLVLLQVIVIFGTKQ
ncbi:unnamed protein product [Protopolystoma xenopodis]|uniref:Uncharacterized protein n=1 Tax=Protopolystoma xenopodis TaxID=117903 RepID=A0A448WSH7_9PLAT|nr:unnamed protein product [Protopolystoma xenopodis]